MISGAALLRDDSAQLAVAMSIQNAIEIKQYFRSYRATAGRRFYDVDLSLKRVCEGVLRQIERPLVWVLGALE